MEKKVDVTITPEEAAECFCNMDRSEVMEYILNE